jgi:hypothetical protein
MKTSSRRKSLTWLLAVGFAATATVSYAGHVGNGITAGALVGLPGREGDVAKLQQYALSWLAAAVMFQAGVAVGLYFLLDVFADAARWPRLVGRSVVAVLMSFPFTFLVAAIMSAAMRWFYRT